MFDWLKRASNGLSACLFINKTLTGKTMRKAENYEAQLKEFLCQPTWSPRRSLFGNELCFLIRK